MRRLFFPALVLALFVPFASKAANVDLGIGSDDISFSGSGTLVAGDQVRLYATVHNVGDEDVDGYVSFFQGSLPIGDSQVISVRADGVPEEVYVDFVVPAGSFNIRAEIRGTDPQDENASNDVAITKLFTPIFDDDRDGVENSKDNCQAVKNADQTDTDSDGQGDACDTDDDNDGVSDDVEAENGSDPLKKDTDGDGVSDLTDAYPADPTRSVVPPPAPVPAPAPTPVPAPTPTPEVAGVVSSEPDAVALAPDAVVPSGEEPVAEPIAEIATDFAGDNLGYSTNAAFRFSRSNWKTYTFTTLVPAVDGQRVEWNFGDGTMSNKRELTHVFTGTGDFAVQLKVTNPDGSVSEGDTVISVPFWTMENPVVAALVGFLGILLLIGLVLLARLLFARRKEDPFPEENLP